MDTDTPKTPRGDSTQSLARAIRILEVVAEGPISLPALTERLNLPRSTVYRLASALVDNGLLDASGRSGYRIAQKMYELGSAYAR